MVTYEPDGRTVVITIRRAEVRNAVDPGTAMELRGHFQRFDQDPNLDVAVLTGGGATFCSGFDLRAVDEGVPSEADAGPMGPTWDRVTKPVLAAVEGYAVAGGLELALWCDLRIASESAVFGVFNRRVGVPLVDLGTIRLPRLIGESRALDLVLTGRPVAAQEALAMGLVNRVVPDGKALLRTIQLAKEIASFPQRSLRNDRLSLLEQWSLSEAEAQRNEWRHGQDSFASGEPVAGARHFLARGDGSERSN